MKSLLAVIVGQVLVIADVSFNNVDVLPDPIGWLLTIAGIFPLANRNGWFLAAGLAAGGAFLLSCLEYVVAIQDSASSTGSTLPLLGAWFAQIAFVFCTCTAIMHVVGNPYASTASRIRLLTVILGGLGLIITAASSTATVEGGAAALVIGLVLANLVVAIWFLVLLYRVRDRPLTDSPEPA